MLRSFFNLFKSRVKKVPVGLMQESKPYVLPRDYRRVVHASNAALRGMKKGRRLTGRLGMLDRLTKRVAAGKSPVGQLVEWWDGLESMSKDSPARHVHPRNKRA